MHRDRHDDDHPHDARLHRFEHAEDWVAQLDDPTRDAWQKPHIVIAALQLERGMTVADIGAGTGYFERHLSRAVGPEGQVLALDVEPDMVRYLAERAQREHLGNVRAALAQTADPMLAPHSTDRVLIVNGWHHIPDRVSYAKKLKDALRPAGRMYVVDFTREATKGPPPELRIAAEAVVDELTQAGLRAHVSTLALPDQYIVVATLA